MDCNKIHLWSSNLYNQSKTLIMKTETQPKRNTALGVYILSITTFMLTYTALTVSQYL